MKKAINLFAILLIMSITLYAGDGKKYGKDITLKEKTSISEILKSPESFEGKKVLVEGTVVGVCDKMGCWIEVAGEKEGEKIKVKVNDGEIVFPVEAKGKTALVEGEVYSVTVEKKKEGCSDEHKEGDKKACCSKEKKPEKVYQLKGLGAIIK
ncbi:MAG: DUF4920 domain-containing protein [Ignavibacteria bacterium]|nr:MAG: DUF4920 domain-containing protein [Ignavibacteria bacterium]